MIPAIEVQDLKKHFVTRSGPLFRKKKSLFHAVKGVSFSIEPGRIFSLLGPNGAGKTTTIKMLATLLIPSAGTARIAGFDVVRDENQVRRTMTAVLPGERTLFWKLTVAENLRYFASLYGMSRADGRARTEELLSRFGLEDKKASLVEKLSTGQRQKVVLSRALLPNPSVILLDEPTLGLDPTAAKGLRAMIREIRDRGTTILLTTHYMYEADELSDEVAIIHGGRIVAHDTPEALKESLDAQVYIRFETDRWSEDTSRLFEGRFPGACLIESDSGSSDATGCKLTAKLADRRPGIAELGEFCRERGVQLHTVRVDEPSLEDVFIEKTGTPISEADDAREVETDAVLA